MADVQRGFWVNHNRAGPQGMYCTAVNRAALNGNQAYQYLVSDRQATLTSNAVAVALTLALPRLYVIFKRLLPTISHFVAEDVAPRVSICHDRLYRFMSHCVRRLLSARSSTLVEEGTSLELAQTSVSRNGNHNQRILTGLSQTLQSSSSTEDAVSRLARRHLAMPRLTIGNIDGQGLRQSLTNLAEEPKAFVVVLAFMLLLFAVYIGLQILAISSSFIIGDSAALITKGACAYSFGRWDDSWDAVYKRVRHSVYGDLTKLALNYAESCYSAQTQASRCRDMLTRTLPYEVINGSNCPFPAKDMCMLGEGSGITFDTGYLNSNLLGINAENQFEFRRRTTCAPVNNSDTYIKIRNISHDEVEIRYNYDDRSPGITDRFTSIRERKFRDRDKYAFQNYQVQYGSRSCYIIDVLILASISQTPSRHINGWLRPSLIPDMSATTFFFIDKKGLVYSSYSDDPIFPATTPLEEPWLSQPKWIDLDIARKVLGCCDEKHIRETKSGLEWYVLADKLYDRLSNNSWNVKSPTLAGSKTLPLSNTALTELRLLSLALRFSDTGYAVYLAPSQWLDAASRVVKGIQSLPLDSHQWQLESRKLFNISLARMQTELLHMARGERLDPSIFGYDLLNGSLVDPCGMIKIHADGMKNVSIVGLAGMLGAALFLWLMTIETGDTIVLVWLIDKMVKPTVFGLCVIFSRVWRITLDPLFRFWTWMLDVISRIESIWLNIYT